MTADKLERIREAPGRPGKPPRWCSGSKQAGGTSRTETCLVWFTIGRGVLNEVYYPRVDTPCTRELFLIVTGPDGFYSDERADCNHEIRWIADGVPGFTITSTCAKGRYRLDKTVITDDRLNVVLQRTRFTALQGTRSDYRLYAYLNPHVRGRGSENTAWVAPFKDQTLLFAERGDVALALMCSAPFAAASVGFVGKSDGPDDLKKSGRLTETYLKAAGGNVALIGEIDLSRGSDFVLAVGFGLGDSEAAHHARGGILRDFDAAAADYARRWDEWQRTLLPLADDPPPGRDLYRASTATLLAHTNKSIPGAVASLAIPWGDSRGDEDLLQGAYHLVWSRDLVQHGGALVAIGAAAEARRILEYLQVTQESDGHWPQNMWVSGEAFWDGIQVDQAAQPILLADLAFREGALNETDRAHFWPMVRRAAGYVARNGASTEQDRWEEERGYNPYTLATMITALLTAAAWADAAGESDLADWLRTTADVRDGCIEGWCYVRDTPLARRLKIDGYYARILPPESVEPAAPGQPAVRLREDSKTKDGLPAAEVVSVDALALVRFGLRAADDPRILNTLTAIDATLRLETDRGPIWHRYIGDSFGEPADGSAYDPDAENGVGRAWPLLIGERAHYELARGDRSEAERLCAAMANYASDTGLLSEQVWDADDIPEKDLVLGEPTGSAMPLLWAHSEYLKLRRSLHERAVFDQPPFARERYEGKPAEDAPALWRSDHPLAELPAGRSLRVEASGEMGVHWQIGDGPRRTHGPGDEFLGLRAAVIPAEQLPEGMRILFTVAHTGEDGHSREDAYELVVKASIE